MGIGRYITENGKAVRRLYIMMLGEETVKVYGITYTASCEGL